MIEHKNLNAAKLQVANDNDIKSKLEIIDFFGNEFNLMIKTYLQSIYRHEVFSSCNSSYCSNKELLVECTSYPSRNVVSYDESWTTPTIIAEKINDWFAGVSTARCSQKVPLTVPEGFYFTEEDSVTE